MAKPSHRALFDASPGRAPSSPLRGGAAAASVASPSASSAPGNKDKESLRKRGEAEFDVSEELSGYGLQGVKVTDDDLLALVEELGLGGEEAGDLVKGLSDPTDKADRAKAGDTEVREGADGGSEQPEAEAKPAVAREEAEVAEGDGVEKVETKVANVAST
jgi:hypothetical protein